MVMLQISMSYLVTLTLFLALYVLFDTASSPPPRVLETIVGGLVLFFPVLLAAGAFYFIWSE